MIDGLPSIRFATLLQRFFCEQLMNQRSASPQTVASYRDTFCLLLNFIQDRNKVEPSAIGLELNCFRARIFALTLSQSASPGNWLDLTHLGLWSAYLLAPIRFIYRPSIAVEKLLVTGWTFINWSLVAV